MSRIIIFQIILLTLLLSMLLVCRDPEAERKLDYSLKLQLKQLKESSQMDQKIPIVFRVNEDMTELHHEVLSGRGVEIVAHVGSIYTATSPAKAVYGLAKFRFIDYIQGQKKFKTHIPDSTDSNNTLEN